MTIKNEYDHAKALLTIESWLKKRDYTQRSLREVQNVILAVEVYMGMPLPAKNFILTNCLDGDI